MYIKKIIVHNFKQLKNVELDLQRNTTLLAGPNNSGKTSLILLLKRMLDKNPNFTTDDFNIYDKNIWTEKIYEALISIYNKSNNKDEDIIINEFFNILFPISNDKISEKPEIINPEITVKIQVDYDDKDNISNFANYIMDLDITRNSFYFIYKVTLNKDKFKKLVKENWSKLTNRLNKNRKQSIIDNMLEMYSSSMIIKYYFTDEKYESLSEIKNGQEFRDLFNFKYIVAARPVDDSLDKDHHLLSKELIDLASKEDSWKNEIEKLPDKVLSKLDKSKIQSTIRKVSIKALNSLINSVSKTNGGHKGNVSLDLDVTNKHIEELVMKATNAKYSVDDKTMGNFYLKETSQGLGYSNLIYIHTQIENYITSKDELKINFLIIEEPESHMHPQMQYVFSRMLLDQYDKENLQGLITTHSSEIVRGVSIEKLRVIREETLFNSKIYDLSIFINNIKPSQKTNNNDLAMIKDFKSFYESIGISELVFADAAILYEGDTERIYLNKIISLPEYEKLQQKYIAYIQVGGAYAYNFKSILEFLKIKSLILTDIDYNKMYNVSKQQILSSSTTNATIKKFFDDSNFNDSNKPKPQTFVLKVEEIYKWIKDCNHIISKTKKEGLDGKESESELIYLSFQTESDNYTRTLEAAMLCKKFKIKGWDSIKRSSWLKMKESSKLHFSIPNNYKDSTGKEINDSEFTMIDILNSTSNGKTDFMYSVILNGYAKEMLPNYIKDGLKWLMK